MVKTNQMLTKLKIYDKESPETHNEQHGCILFVQVKDMENYTINVCFFLNLRKIKLMNTEETLYLVDHFMIWERPNVEQTNKKNEFQKPVQEYNAKKSKSKSAAML